jgi:3-deoxy-D-manno-octulosonic-acid transferase
VLTAYRLLTHLASPLLPLWLHARARRGKEDAARLPERFGHASLPRPEGPLLWVHAASVGESQTVLPLLERLLAAWPRLCVLMTTGTVTSAMLLAKRPHPRLFHQYVPVDRPSAVQRFMAYWKPELAFWVESEFWPNLMQAAHAACPMLLLNGRVSARSAARWQLFPEASRALMRCFAAQLAASEADAARLSAMGGQAVQAVGNLKFSSPPLAAEARALDGLREATAGRPLWLAASTHPGEETQIAAVHRQLAPRHPGLLTLVVPRHPQRGEAIATELEGQGLRVARRSHSEPITRLTDIYLADTMGELGVFYRLSPLAFIGGSLVPHGGQNPFEAARLGAAVLYGPHMQNFHDFCLVLEAAGAALSVTDAEALAEQVEALISHPERREACQRAAKAAVEEQADVESRVWQALFPYAEAAFGAAALSSLAVGAER